MITLIMFEKQQKKLENLFVFGHFYTEQARIRLGTGYLHVSFFVICQNKCLVICICCAMVSHASLKMKT